MVLRALIFCAFWIEISRKTSCASYLCSSNRFCESSLSRFCQLVLLFCVQLWQNRTTYAQCFLKMFAMRYFVDDHKLCDASVALLTLQLHCASVHLSTMFFILEATLFVSSSLFTQLLIEPVLLILVKQSVIRCTEICLDCQ